MGVAMAMVLGHVPWGSVRASAPLPLLSMRPSYPLEAR
jgi:hypothetical protein